LLRRIEALDVGSQRFPIDDVAVRPTRLGNILRFYEDPIEEEIGQPIEGFVQELFHRLPVVIQVDHDQLRSRLDLYCSLVLVFSLIGLLSAGLLATVNTWWEALIGGFIGAALAWLSYRAAVTSARAYGSYLESLTQFAAPRMSDVDHAVSADA
jgi:hypothetical protein